MKFVMSYSCGKDSALALHKMLEQGHQPVGLLVMVNENMQVTWFHGVQLDLLEDIAASLEIPLFLCSSKGQDYDQIMEEGLLKAKNIGAEMAVFGDMDIEEHRLWCSLRCQKVGLEPSFPLWGRSRLDNVEEVLALGYTCLIKCLKNQELPCDFLGKTLDRDIVDWMKANQVDVCGENGEYHTLVVDGPIFHYPIAYRCEEILDFEDISAINIVKDDL